MADQQDKLYPNAPFSVDDILNEVRLMRQQQKEHPSAPPAFGQHALTPDEIVKSVHKSDRQNLRAEHQQNTGRSQSASSQPAAAPRRETAEDRTMVFDRPQTAGHTAAQDTRMQQPTAEIPAVRPADPALVIRSASDRPAAKAADIYSDTAVRQKQEPSMPQPTVAKSAAPAEQPAASKDILSDFLSKTTDSQYKPGGSQEAKKQIDMLFGEEAGGDTLVNPFSKKRRRAPNVLTPEEILGSTMEINALKAQPPAEASSRPAAPQPSDDTSTNKEEFFSKIIDKAAPEQGVPTQRETATPARRDVSPHAENEVSRQPEQPVRVSQQSGDLPLQSQIAQKLREADDAFSLDILSDAPPEQSTVTEPPAAQTPAEPLPAVVAAKTRPSSRVLDDLDVNEDALVEKIQQQAQKEEEDTAFEADEIDDYRTIKDAEAVRLDLDYRSAQLSRKLTFTAIATALLLALTLLPAAGVTLPDFISPSAGTYGYLILNALFFAVVLATNLPGIFRGFFSIFRLRPDVDAATGVAALAATAHLAYLFTNTELASNGAVYTAVAGVGLVLNLIGKQALLSRVKGNLNLVATNGVKQSSFLVDGQQAAAIAGEDELGVPVLCCRKSVINLRNYLHNSFCEDPSDKVAQTLSPIGLAAALIVFFVSWLVTADLPAAVGYLAAVAAVAVPSASLLSTNVPLLRATRRLRELGGILSGYNAVDTFSQTDCVVLDSEDMFPAGSIDLVSLKALGGAQVDNVILYAAALTISAGGCLADVFDRMIEGRRKLLPPAHDILYTDGAGITGTVSGRQVQIGNRTLLENAGVFELPDPEFERKLLRSGNHPLYLAVDGELAGLFILKYTTPDDELVERIGGLVDAGVGIYIKTNDPNITEKLIANLFYIPAESVAILPADAVEAYNAVTVPSENGSSLLADQNSAAAFAASITACKKLRRKMVLGIVVQTICTVLALLAALFFAFTGGAGWLQPHWLLAYLLGSAALVLLLPAFIRIR